MGFTHTGGAYKKEGTNGAVGVLESDAVALDSLDHSVYGLILSNNFLLDLVAHFQELFALFLGDTF